MVSSLDLYVTSLCATDVFNLLDDKYLATKLLLFTFLTCIYIFTLSMLSGPFYQSPQSFLEISTD